MIRRLAADGVPKAKIAERLGISRTTVIRAVNSTSPPVYERKLAATSFTPFEARVRALLVETPSMPATVLAERVGWTGSIRWFRNNVKRLRPEQQRIDPADRIEWAAGDAAQCDLWFPPKKIPLEDGTSKLLPVLVITPANSRFITGRMIPTDRVAGFPRHTRPDTQETRHLWELCTWCPRRGLNPRPTDYESAALTG